MVITGELALVDVMELLLGQTRESMKDVKTQRSSFDSIPFRIFF